MEKTNQENRRAFLPLLLIFIFVNAALIIFRVRWETWGMDTNTMLIGNLLLFTLFLVSYSLHRRAMENSSTQIFLRNVYSGMLLKLFGCAIAAFVYIFIARSLVNKPALFGCLFLYMLYTVLELKIVLKLSKPS
jgi:uncharacterized membrane protein